MQNQKHLEMAAQQMLLEYARTLPGRRSDPLDQPLDKYVLCGGAKLLMTELSKVDDKAPGVGGYLMGWLKQFGNASLGSLANNGTFVNQDDQGKVMLLTAIGAVVMDYAQAGIEALGKEEVSPATSSAMAVEPEAPVAVAE